MLKRMLFHGILLSCCVMLSACAATNTPDQQAQEAQEAAPVKETVVVEEKQTNTCDALLDEAIQEAKTTMKSADRSCEGMTMEVTPMWSLDYKGAVHIRVFDANGKKIKDEIVN